MAGTINLSASLTDAGKPSAVIAFPLYNGAPDSNKVATSMASPIAEDGSFAAAAPSGGTITDAVFVVVDESGKVVNTIGMPSTEKDNLLNIPVSSESKTLDVGTVLTDPLHPDAKTQRTAQEGAAELGISGDKVTQDADTGAVLRTVKNIVNNCKADGSGSCVDVQTTHEFGGSVATAVNAWSQPSIISYSGYSFIISFMGMSYTFDDVCKAGNPVMLTLFPPSTINGTSNMTGAISVTSTEGVSNKGLTVTKPNNGGRQCEPEAGTTSTAYIGESGTRFNFIPFSGAQFPDAIPKGDWRLTVVGPSVADEYKFDLASASPIDEAGIARAWTPVVKVTADATTKVISKVEVKFYTYNAASGWVETVDTEAMLSAIGGAGEEGNTSAGGVYLTFDDSSTGTRVTEGSLLALTAGTNVFAASGFDNQWRLPLADGETATGTAHPTALRITYTLRGTQLNFNLK